MPIISGRQVGIRGLGFQGAGRPGTPNISAVSRVSDTEVDITWNAQSNGAPITAITITSSPSISLSYSGTSSTVRVTGTFASDTNYTFTVAAVNAVGASAASNASSSVKPNPPWVLAQTFNSSTNYTISNNVLEYAVYTVGGGNGGGNNALSAGGNGGAGSGVKISSPSLGTTYAVTVGGAGGTSSFGNLINSAGTGNASGIVNGNGAGNGGAAGSNFPGTPGTFRGSPTFTPNAYCGTPNPGNGNAGGNIVLSGVATIQYGGGGGGGGGTMANFCCGGCPSGYCTSGTGGAGGGGNGGTGQGYTRVEQCGGCDQLSTLNPLGGNSGTIGGGGGGSGNALSGGSSGGRVLIYTKTA